MKLLEVFDLVQISGEIIHRMGPMPARMHERCGLRNDQCVDLVGVGASSRFKCGHASPDRVIAIARMYRLQGGHGGRRSLHHTVSFLFKQRYLAIYRLRLCNPVLITGTLFLFGSA